MNILKLKHSTGPVVSDRVRHLTARALENGVKWDIVKEVCQLIMNDPLGDSIAKEALEALKVWVKSKTAQEQISSLQMLHALVKNCDSRFVSNLATKKWMERLVKIVKTTQDPHVRGIILQLIAEWWHDHKRNPQLVYFGKAAETLVQRGYSLPVISRPPDAGRVAASSTGPRRNSVGGREQKAMPKPQMASAMPEGENPSLQNLRKALGGVKTDIAWLKEALSADVRDIPQEQVRQVVTVCSEWQKRIQSLLNSEAPEDLTIELLSLNDEIVLQLKRWERIKPNLPDEDAEIEPEFDQLAKRHNASAVKVEDVDVDFDPEFDSDDENINDLLAMRSTSSSKATLQYRRHVQEAILKVNESAKNLRGAQMGVRVGMVKMTQGFNNMCVALVKKIDEFDGPVGGGGGGGGGASTAEVFALRTKIQELERQIADTQSSAEADSNLKIEKLENEVAILKQRILEVEAERDELEAKFESDIGDKIDRVNQQLEAEQREKAEMASELKTMSDRLKGAENDLAERDEMHKKTLELSVDRYRQEAVKRRQLYNQLQELKGNIRVICRIRPLVTKEKEAGEEMSTSFPDNYSLDIYNQATSSNKRYEFDRVFGGDSTQEGVFEEVQPLVVSILDGYNVCIFAYGQTGAGKTFTMDGDDKNPGLNRRSVTEMFKLAAENPTLTYDFEVSMLEVYNEEIADLLSHDKERAKLEVKQNAKKQVYVDKLTWKPAKTADQAMALLAEGIGNRRSRCTNMNEHSSRSHMVFSIRVTVQNKLTGVNLVGTLYLVDLAGSERVAKSGATGAAFTEAANINKSLFALGDVIKSLTSKSQHCPYRNSKLTYLLQDAIGGDAKTLMFVNCSPAFSNIQESICSLTFASRVRTVEKGQATKQGDTQDVINLKNRIKELEEKLEKR